MADKQLLKVGEYSVLKGGKDAGFWPLEPGTLVKDVIPMKDPFAPVAPQSKNKKNAEATNVLTLPPDFGIFDIIIRFSGDKVNREKIKADDVTKEFKLRISGKPSIKKMPLAREVLAKDDDPIGDVRICFAVRVETGEESFEGELKLTAKEGKTNRSLTLLLKVKKNERAADMFVFFCPHKTPKLKHCWFRLEVVEAANKSQKISGAKVLGKILRDNKKAGYQDINRRVEFTTAGDGKVRYQDRDVLGFPIDWPLIFNITHASHVPRGHAVRLKDKDRKNNLEPFQATAAQMTKTADVDLSSKRIFLDPGHGVVYGDTKNRRCQEWYVAHVIAERIAKQLTTTYKAKPENLFWTRTAGFGLIAPGDVAKDAGPENGAKNFKLDFSVDPWKINIVKSASLKDISDLALVKHDASGAAQAVSDADRNRLLDTSSDTVKAILEKQVKGKLASGMQIKAGSFTWDKAARRSSCTIERTKPKKGEAKEVGVQNGSAGWDSAAKNYVFKIDTLAESLKTKSDLGKAFPIPISKSDVFLLDRAMQDTIIERSARWSIAREIGGDGTFQKAARDAMGAGVFDYMKKSIRRYVLPSSPADYFKNGTMGWSAGKRNTYLNSISPECDLYLTIHENAGGGIGGMTLVCAETSGANKPPDDQIRIGKFFLKYVDAFDVGTRSGGIAKEATGSDGKIRATGMLRSGNKRREKYAYFELEFMDGKSPKSGMTYRYEEMVTDSFLNTVTDQIVAGIIEILVNKQSDMDDVTYTGDIHSLW